MRVFKFGGASVKDAQGVRNVLRVLKELEAAETVVVISAMGKMTNAFEGLVKAYFDSDQSGSGSNVKGQSSTEEHLAKIRNFHFQIIDDLLPFHLNRR